MLVSILLYGLVAILSLTYVYLKNSKRYWPSRGVFTKPANFLFGHFAGVAKSIHITDRLREFYTEFKGKDKFCGMYLFNRPIALITDLDLIRDVCVKDFSSFHDRGVYVNEEADPLSGHLFSLAGEKWRNMRNKLSPTFTSGKLKLMLPSIVDIAGNMQMVIAKQVETDKTIEIKRLCSRFSTDVIATVAFGLDAKTLENDESEMVKISNVLFKPSTAMNFKFFFLTSYQKVGKMFGMKIVPDIVTQYFMGILRETVDNREKNDIKRNDFIDILIKMKNSGKVEAVNSNEEDDYVGTITFNELAAQAFVFFFAGFETSSTAMSFCLLQLAINQDIQDRVRTEIQSVMKKHNDRITYEGVVEMCYLEQCFNEAMRMFPPVHSMIREANEDYKVHGTEHVLEKGTQLFIPTFSIHNDEDIYPDPLKYDPDRFTPINIGSRHSYAFLPFGEGPRICIGMRFALLQSKIGLATILSNFRVTVNEKTQLPPEREVDNPQMGVKGGIWLNFEKI